MAEKNEPTNVRTLTLTECGVDGKDAIRERKSVFMARLIGVINEVAAKEAHGRAFEVCFGEFRGINPAGAVFESDKMIFPGGTGESIMAAARIANAKGEALQFAIDVFSTPDAQGKKSPLGYGYVAKNLIDTRSKSQLQEIAVQLNKSPMPTVEAPEKAGAAKK